jgi:apolipoprotein N-acyltransferase
VEGVAREAGVHLLVGAPDWRDGRPRNSAVTLGPDGRVLGRYDKRHLVPFGEYVPRWLPLPGPVARLVGDFVAGRGAQLVPWGTEKLGVAICYEIVFPGEVATLVRAGATALVTITNDAWYGDTAAPWQHLRAARFRAAENRRPLLRAAITGVSAAVGPDGSVERQLGVGERGVIATQLAGRADRTLYSRAPWAVPLACALATAGLLARRGSRSGAGARA